MLKMLQLTEKITYFASLIVCRSTEKIGTLAHYLDGESVETSVYGDHGTGYECGGVARQPL